MNLPYLKPGTLIILNIDEFDEINYKKANWESILKGEETLDEILSKFEVIKVEFNKLTAEALKDIDIPHKDKIRTRNFFALGLVSWIFMRPIEPIIKFIKENFGKKTRNSKSK